MTNTTKPTKARTYRSGPVILGALIALALSVIAAQTIGRPGYIAAFLAVALGANEIAVVYRRRTTDMTTAAADTDEDVA